MVRELVRRWWNRHVAPTSRRTHGNITDPRWRPRPAAVVAGLPILVVLTAYGGWFVSLAAAFAYVAKVTTGRAGNPWRGRHGGFRDVLVTGAIGVLLYAPADPSGWWVTAGLLLGVHVSYLEKLPPAWVRSLTVAQWRDAGPGERAWTVARIVLILGAVVLSGYAAGPLPLGASLAVVLVLAVVTRIVRRDGFRPHLHHWFVFAWLAVLTADVPLLLGFCTGAFVEGAARWSCAPLWHRREWAPLTSAVRAG